MFQLETEFEPSGDQPQAIEALSAGVLEGRKAQVLLGVTGSGKTYTMANVIGRVQKPTLILAHNKTLAAQLYQEFKAFFPQNAVEYFVSYYDYYQPEAYIARTDTYIEKDLAINEKIDKMRLSATRALLERDDVIIVASVSCIYGLGMPEYFAKMQLQFETGGRHRFDGMLLQLVEMHYKRNETDFRRGTFRTRGDTLEVFPAYEEDIGLRVEFFDDEVERISLFDPLTGKVIERLEKYALYPASHHVTPEEVRHQARETIRLELMERLELYEQENKLLEKQRLQERTLNDLEMIREIGFCKGIENYSRHFSGRSPGEAPPCLLDYFPDDFLLFVDESHVTIPQLHAMYNGDRARKVALVEHGFRLPSAYDNRPLKFEETYRRMSQTIYVSATPSDWEVRETGGDIVEQIIRPTGLLDPKIEVRPANGQVDDCMEEIRVETEKGGRVLVTTLTKRLAEELTSYLTDLGVRAKYLHSDIVTLERIQIIRDLRAGEYDVLVGINLLREGLDMPEVTLVAILDADKEGFLRSTTSLIQTCGRAARNSSGRVIMYADKQTDSIKKTLETTQHRRAIQEAYNSKHGITPQTVIRGLGIDMPFTQAEETPEAEPLPKFTPDQLAVKIAETRAQMREAAKALKFEEAAHLRDLLRQFEAMQLAYG
jgi:excinuclease ABC subunit B